jgi:hypothetical protein
MGQKKVAFLWLSTYIPLGRGESGERIGHLFRLGSIPYTNFREPDTGEGRRISLPKQFSEQDVRALPLDQHQLQFTNSLGLNGAEA